MERKFWKGMEQHDLMMTEFIYWQENIILLESF